MNHEVTVQRKPDLLRSALKSMPTIFVLVVMSLGWMAIHHINSSGGVVGEDEEATSESEATDTLVLAEGKLNSAQFESLPVEPQAVQHVHTVPGRIRYDATKHVGIKAPTDGILAEILVTPGDSVDAGQLLAVMRSPEVGQARAAILKRRELLEIAKRVLSREQALSHNLLQMNAMLDGGESVDAIEAEFKEKPLGAYREGILTSYAKMRLADELIDKLKPLVITGSVPGRTLRERESERQLAEASFRTARDEAAFSVQQARLKAEAEAAEAERQLDLAWQSLEGLLGYKEDRETANLSGEDALSRLEVRAPFAGSIESYAYANAERVDRGDCLLVLANTDSLYVEASIRESDWPTIALKSGIAVTVRVPALEDREFVASVRYFGREVHSDTNSVPLVASIENDEGLLRPGMFVRVTVPIGASRNALSVRPESVIQHEDQQFVFVEMQNGVFKRVDVATGQASADWVEVTNGLTEGQLVVTNGAFLLKSELLLQGEED
ncbi:MAG: efflux RND transporter periplasmic adaptor subunit [Planctomycetales bacterium]|nr:efflux RND transporter periplasmic adaptor subunit [Planctomycetales bacterium]